MIAVDTSALMAIVLGEPEADACIATLAAEDDLVISAATVAEALIVAARRHVGEEMLQLIDGLGFEIVAVTGEAARRVATAYARWGKGAHPAALNFGDCFAYDVAKERGCPLLYVGDDFGRTDVERSVEASKG
ncbi:MAG TPA: type II toxin-antitoxin system VapC family toxin [Methylosinus sp.]|jgi:ribonuclease VapC